MKYKLRIYSTIEIREAFSGYLEYILEYSINWAGPNPSYIRIKLELLQDQTWSLSVFFQNVLEHSNSLLQFNIVIIGFTQLACALQYKDHWKCQQTGNRSYLWKPENWKMWKYRFTWDWHGWHVVDQTYDDVGNRESKANCVTAQEKSSQSFTILLWQQINSNWQWRCWKWQWGQWSQCNTMGLEATLEPT